MTASYMDAFGQDAEREREAAEFIRGHRSWFIALGVALVVLGVVAAGSALAFKGFSRLASIGDGSMLRPWSVTKQNLPRTVALKGGKSCMRI